MSTPSGLRLPISTASEADIAEALAARVCEASAAGEPLRIVGGDTKQGYGRPVSAQALRVSGHRGVIDYQPSELVITARAGTPLVEIEALLGRHGQMLGFEPLLTGAASTLGGAVASGLSGPRRPFAGAARDQILGVTILDGRGRRMRLGGVVFKNVAGFDAFRLMAGALGSLGVLLDVSLRVAPRPAREITLAFPQTWATARLRVADLLRRPLPVTALAHDGERLLVRLAGSEAGLETACAQLGGQAASGEIWDRLRQPHEMWPQSPRLWRLALPRGSALDALPGLVVRDWAGAQVWLASDAPSAAIRTLAAQADGHATLFRGAGEDEAVFDALPSPMLAIHRRLKAAFDPAGILNPGRLYAEL
ncbi:MAG TPA: glycolate oxidase subunit GlcE [Caulobacteraceae bacterium]|jgi:glycolate oxidase FAD binding subunit|nr:glycolate oxidase subunit GlcE [Caulobacteraceae bacterium]